MHLSSLVSARQHLTLWDGYPDKLEIRLANACVIAPRAQDSPSS